MVDLAGRGFSEFVRELPEAEMTKRKPPGLVPHEDPPWSPLDRVMVPNSVRLEIPLCEVSRYEFRRMGEIVENLGRRMRELSHNPSESERHIALIVAAEIRSAQYRVLPTRRAKRRSHRDE